MQNADKQLYDVAIIGGGASGTSLFYTLAKYSNVGSVVLIEKYGKLGQVNSRASNNSQTLHVGDIETNYSLSKVREVKPAALMLARYAESLPPEKRDNILFKVPKMVLAVGAREVAMLEKRHTEIGALFPDLRKLSRDGIAAVEPKVVEGRSAHVPLLALATDAGYAVDFEAASQSFADEALKLRPEYAVMLDTEVARISREGEGYAIICKGKPTVRARSVVVDADSYSLLFARQLGYGAEYSLIPIAGSFYFSESVLRGKVYTVQEPLLPFAAVHGDPDVRVPGLTRWGPTARFHPVLESRAPKTSLDYFRSSGLGSLRTWLSFFRILLEPVRAKYLFLNMLYELPWIGKRMFLHNVRKIVPTMRPADFTKAIGYGGMRLQRVNTRTGELELGEGKIIGERIIFNMTPSPGASVCLYNAMRDAETITGFLGGEVLFRRTEMERDLRD